MYQQTNFKFKSYNSFIPQSGFVRSVGELFEQELHSGAFKRPQKRVFISATRKTFPCCERMAPGSVKNMPWH